MARSRPRLVDHVRPRTTVALLEPATTADEYDQSVTIDWTLPPTVHDGVLAAVEPVGSTEAVLTASTIVSRLRLYLPGDTTVDSTWRVRWQGDDYLIDGDVEPWVNARGTQYLHCLLKKVTR